MEFTIGLSSPFSLEYTLGSGQVFRWENRGEWWYGVVSGCVLKMKQEGDLLTCSTSSDAADSSFVRRYFALDEDLQSILASIMKGKALTQAVHRFYGLRLIRQERWECLASFVLATNSNIPRIRRMVEAICARFGSPVEFEGRAYSAFPKPEALAEATVAELRECGLGYRASYLSHVSQSVRDGKVDFSELALLDYEAAHATLLKELFGEKLLLGVGPKVADCVLLFSCDKNEAFPIDVWMGRILASSYPRLVEPRLRSRLASGKKAGLTKAEYLRLSSAARKHFGSYAGYAQQYLFMKARSEGVSRP